MGPVGILAIGGSLKADSNTGALLAAAARLLPEGASLTIFDRLREVPPFDPGAAADAAVEALRGAIAGSDAVLIATPEYAYGTPGTLKNALDWLVGSGELNERPTAVLSSSPNSSGGLRAQQQVVQTLVALNAALVDAMAVPFVGLKLGPAREVADAHTRRRLEVLLTGLCEAARERGPAGT